MKLISKQKKDIKRWETTSQPRHDAASPDKARIYKHEINKKTKATQEEREHHTAASPRHNIPRQAKHI